ncbi:MAG: NAD+ synthase [Thiotrichales bacterium]
MIPSLRIAIAQVNLLVGDVEGNTQKVEAHACRARDELGAHLVVFPELTLTGYPPEDLLLRPSFLECVEASLFRVSQKVKGIDVVLGLPWQEGRDLYNAAFVLRDGKPLTSYYKQILPNYSVFDEKRYFRPGTAPCVFDCQGVRIGVTICEDIWQPEPASLARDEGAELLVNLNASPYHIGKLAERVRALRDRCVETGLPIVYVNAVGGQDELVFDGQSLVMTGGGETALQLPAFSEGLFTVDTPFAPISHPVDLTTLPETPLVYQALVLGVRDYLEKNGFAGALLGLSGGIDSALTLAIAVDAIGAERVEAVMMPSRYTAPMSLEDAAAEADALGVAYREISIEPVFQQFIETLAPVFEGLPMDVTEENIQARCRGVLLMAISNKSGRLLLTTGNKSEMAVGYATLYGDMAGGFAPLKDVVKTRVFELARYRNSLGAVIPERVLTRPPSAELRADQKDSDSLPPYEILDPILERFIELEQSMQEIKAAGFDMDLIKRVATLVLRNEYKRRQAPPGVRVTRRGFGKDRRYPITSGYQKFFNR